MRRFDDPPGRNLYETAHRKETHLERLLGEVRRAGLFTCAPLNSQEHLLRDWLERRLERAKEDSQAALLHTVAGMTRGEAEALQVEEGLHAEKWARHEEEQGAHLRELFDAAGCRMGEDGFHPYSGAISAFIAVHTGAEWEEIRDGALRARERDQDEGSSTAEVRRRLVARIKAQALDILRPPARRAYLRLALYAYRNLSFQFPSDDPDTPGETVLLFPRLVEEVEALLKAEDVGELEQTPPAEAEGSGARLGHITLQGGYSVPYYAMPGARDAYEERMREIGRSALEEFVAVANSPGGPDRLEGVARRIEARAASLREAWETMVILSMDARFLEPVDTRYTNRPGRMVLDPLGAKGLRGFPGIYTELAEKLEDLYESEDGAPDVEAIRTLVADRLNAQSVIQSAAKLDIEMRLHALRLVLNASDESMQGEVQWLEHPNGRVYVWKGEPVVGTYRPAASEPGAERLSEPADPSNIPTLADLIAPSRRLDYIQDTLIPVHGPEGWGGPPDGSWAKVAEALEGIYLHYKIPTSEWPYRSGGENIHAATLANKVRERERRERGKG